MNPPSEPTFDPGAGASAPTDLSQDGASAVAAGGSTLELQLADLQTRHTEVSDAYLRAKAEAENTRRRGEEEVAKARKFAIDGFAESLLPVKDSLEAAIAIDSATKEQLLEGVHATLRQLTQALERNRVVTIEPPVGTRFDPHQHQAISSVPSEQEPNTVVTLLQKGYLIADRVLRPALVMVAAAR
ncbi:MAG: nucleotide exchange factor GrpE [Pseudomonadota bacterium]|nr:nucleotide exchange factor GrpE [Pseudomonadota bacterium]